MTRKQHSVGCLISQLAKPKDDILNDTSSCEREHARDVFDEKCAWLELLCEGKESPH
jgi:hypothetical protein